MKIRPLLLLVADLLASALIAVPCLGAPAGPAPAAELIPYEKFRLTNGLTVIVHTDRKAPIVAVDLWYHVGSKNERSGKTGFAHLFEHLMFQGTEHYRGDYHRPFEQVGATGLNGTTNFDRTSYFENVPTTAVDLALWMESDRMGHLLGAIDQSRLDEQRGVVQNEKRQNENRPYGRVYERLLGASFPLGHPYHAPTIGSMEDLNAASLEDVKEWFRTYYGAANAILVLAGDIDVATARAKAEQYFGDIPPGPPITRPGEWVAARDTSRRDLMYDRVAQARLERTWNTPGEGSKDAELLGLVAEILGSGKNSRLYDRLVYRDRLADSASAGLSAYEIAGLFAISADVKNGTAPERVEAVIAEELQKFLERGPTQAELDRAKTTVRADFIRGLERIGGFGGKADVLARCEVYEGDPGCYARALETVSQATPQQVRDVARRWLSRGDYTLEVRPQPAWRAEPAAAVDRASGPPAITSFPDLAFPDLQRAKLRNGLPVVIARRPGVPLVRVALWYDAGYAADQARLPGTSSFTMALLGEGTATLNSLALAERAQRLGAQIFSTAGLDTAYSVLATLHDQLEPSLALFADIVRNPTFPQ
ncbi:MAG TPA: insulinase family protein, partial [Steroidobacteraceae bacterium]|nr:insulinase family protein [Steroidobacteraceae bacterium]